MVLEIYTDASMRTFDNGRVFGCSGALCTATGEARYTINPDSTNNKSELIAIFLGVQMAHETILNNPGVYDQIDLYSDSQFGVFGLTRWMGGWIKTMDNNGIIYGSNKQPVKNQELFAMILSYMATNNLKIRFLHQAGHVRYSSFKMLSKANETFKKSNGYSLKPEEVYKISYYNDIVDRTSRSKLVALNPDNFSSKDGGNNDLVRYVIPKGYKDFICK